MSAVIGLGRMLGICLPLLCSGIAFAEESCVAGEVGAFHGSPCVCPEGRTKILMYGSTYGCYKGDPVGTPSKTTAPKDIQKPNENDLTDGIYRRAPPRRRPADIIIGKATNTAGVAIGTITGIFGLSLTISGLMLTLKAEWVTVIAEALGLAAGAMTWPIIIVGAIGVVLLIAGVEFAIQSL